MILWIAVSFSPLVAAPAVARAQHNHDPGEPHADSELGVAVGFVAAHYDQALFSGDYEGVVPAASWSNARFAASITVPFYRLVQNGRTVYGAGDARAAGQATLFTRGAARGGVALAVSLPSGDQTNRLGMGHVMAMPGVWATVARGRLAIAAAAEYGRVLGGGDAHADHGTGPIVDPMTESEVMAAASATVGIRDSVRAGTRASIAVPLGDGDVRVAAGVRAVWSAGRVATAVELQAGLAGDPFTVRGLVETALRF